ncbi:MAG: transglycosylase SLT domain-containing protein [Bdellovibrionota bacterium]
MVRFILTLIIVPFVGCGFSANGIFSKDTDLEQVSYDSYLEARRQEGLSAKVSPKQLPAPVVQLTPEVKREIDFFSSYNAVTVRNSIARKNKLGPVIEKIFNDEGIPLELLSVAIIESSFNPNARSPSGAVGLWQFMKSTGKVYGLDVGFVTDERKDPVRST